MSFTSSVTQAIFTFDRNMIQKEEEKETNQQENVHLYYHFSFDLLLLVSILYVICKCNTFFLLG